VVVASQGLPLDDGNPCFLNSVWWCNQSGDPPKENFAKFGYQQDMNF